MPRSRNHSDLGGRLWRFLVVSIAALVLIGVGYAQEPIDLFPDSPKLSQGYIRVGAWNLRHINLEGQARVFLPGNNDTEDFAILIATFAKVIQDLSLDVVTIVELQPRANEPNRLHQLRDKLNGQGGGPWRAHQTDIEYDSLGSSFGNLQFGLLWNSFKVTINPTDARLLSELRQPRDANGNLTEKRMRAPWLIPVKTGALEFDLLVLHLKSGGVAPQAKEVDALRDYITTRQSAPTPKHLIVLGDWNIRPDKSGGRFRLRKMMAPAPGGNLMRVVTVEDIPPKLEGWNTVEAVVFNSPLAMTLPFTHFNTTSIDTFLDHIAISRTLDELYDHPIKVKLADGTWDLRPGIRIAEPLIPEEDYLNLTDHLPVVLILRTSEADMAPPGVSGLLRIAGALPNPPGDDRQFEEVHLKNTGGSDVPLNGWKITDADGQQHWVLTAQDGVAASGHTVIIVRRGRPMFLNNTGDTIVLINPSGQTVDIESYGNAPSGKLFNFD